VNSYKRLVPVTRRPSIAPGPAATAPHGPRAHVQARQGEGHPHRVPLADPTATPTWPLPHAGRGLKGVEGKYPLPEPVEHDIFEMDAKARAEAGITSLPEASGKPRRNSSRACWPTRCSGSHLRQGHREQEKSGHVPDLRHRFRAQPLSADAVKPRGQPVRLPLFYKAIGKRNVLSDPCTAVCPIGRRTALCEGAPCIF